MRDGNDTLTRNAERGMWNPALRTPHSASAKGQVVLEYFILFAVVAALTLIGMTTFDDHVKAALERFVGAAAVQMAN